MTETSRCLVRDVTLLDVMTFIVAVLSMNMVGGSCSRSKNALLVRKLRNAMILTVHLNAALTSASVESLEMPRCMFVVHEYATPLMVRIFASIDRLSGVTLANAASVIAVINDGRVYDSFSVDEVLREIVWGGPIDRFG